MFKIAVFEITNECNFNCKYCYENLRKKSHSIISVEDFSDFITYHMGLYREVILSGGEPFLHPSWIDFVAILQKHGMKVNFITNGTGIEKIIQNHIKVDVLIISIDSFSATNNLLRTSKRMYSKKDILKLKESGLVEHIYLQVILNKLSVSKDNLEDLLEFCETNQIGFKAKLMDHYNFNKTEQYMLDPDEINEVEKFLSRQVKTRKIDMDISIPSIYGNDFSSCPLIKKCDNLRIRSDGMIFPCEKLDDEKYGIGIISDSSDQIMANLKNVQNKILASIIKLTRGTCSDCTYNATCGKGCPALHKAENSDNICRKKEKRSNL